jgi:dihydroflavonol-4-reductase
MKAFVTGSTGLLGSNLVHLLLAQGFEVKALARSKQKAEQILGKNPHMEIVIGDMEDINGFAGELAGSDVLFHVAAYFREYYGPGDHWAKLKKINVDGTIHLLDEAEKHGLKKTVYVSSSAVIGGTANGTPGDESTPPDEAIEENLYAKSKVLAEQAIAEWSQTHQMPVVLILPTVILGPLDAAPTTMGQAVINLLNRKIPVVPPGGVEFVDARDVAQAMINAVEFGKAGERYIVSQGYHTMREFANLLEKASGVPAPRINVPFAVMLALVWLGERAAIMRGKPVEISVAGLRLMRRRREVTASKAIRDLGVNFRSLEDSLRDEAAWYRANGYVKA